MTAAEHAAAAKEMREDAQAFRDLAAQWETFPTREQYGRRHVEYGEGVRARMEIVAVWMEHIASLEEMAAAEEQAVSS
jgi:hypothetical protein